MATPFENLQITTDFSLRLFGLLRKGGVEVGTQQTVACMQAIVLMETVNEDELKGIYRATLINRKEDLFQLQWIYELLLKAYQSPRSTVQDALKDLEDSESVTVKRRQQSDGNDSTQDHEELAETEGYSVREVDHHKDFQLVPKQDIPAILAELEKIAKKYASMARRKTKASRHKGRLDLRASIRDSVKFDGEIVNWRYKQKIPTHSRFVIVSDVSGSMEIYSIFLLNFLHLLHRNHKMKIESFVFSTRLQSLTKQFRSKNFPEMLKNVALHFSGWSGGTKMGEAIEALNETYSSTVTPHTTVLIMSDGWDTGDVTLLDREMAKLRNRAKSIVWMNPLKGDPLYEPLAIGMATARPYCDEFISGHSIDSLKKFAALINP